MAVPKGQKFVIVPIKKSWFDFSLQNDGKYVTLMGKDRNQPAYNYFKKEEELTDDDIDTVVLMPVAFEYHRSDRMYNKIFDAAIDDDGNMYLIIKREPYE